MTIPTTPNFNFPLPPDGAGSSNGETWGTQFRSMISALDSHLQNIVNSGVVGVDTPPTTPNIWDDEFNGTTLDPSWIVNDPFSNLSVSNGSLCIQSATDQSGNIMKAITGPFRVEAKVIYAGPHGYDYTQVGLLASNSANPGGNRYNAILQARSSDQSIAVQAQRFNSGGWESEYMYPNSPYTTAYFAIQDDGTNITFQVSPDGTHWINIRREASGSWCVVNQVGIEWSGNEGDRTPSGLQCIFFCDWIRSVPFTLP